VPVRNGSVPEAPDGRHMIQCGATLDAATADALPPAAEPRPLAAVELAKAPGEADVPALAAAAVAVVAEEGVAAVIAGSATAPGAPFVSAVPATPGAVAAACAAPGPANATSSGMTTTTIRNSWAMALPDPN
jgi:hypothetical protein